ncbi:MAG: transglutaminase domain-containing protein, partial [Candidatus Brocadiae bacterium]|nr:transglutaminase domain-containing protein [Candidatus Brocadiia bacterium]
RSELTPGSSLKAKKLKKTSIALLLLFFCLSPAIFIAPNRSRLIAYHPLRFFSTYSIGFSPFGFLASKNIKISQESVFQYHAAPGVYYLRGKVLDTYKQGEWKLSCFHQTKLQETPKEIFMHYKLYPDIEMNSPGIHKLSFVQAPQEYLFAPLSCSRVVFAQKFSLYKDQEQIVWAEKPFPETFWIHIQKMPLESLDSMDSKRYLQIPEESKAYFYQKAKKIAGEVSDPARQARKIANYLKDNYPYSLEVKTEGEDPLVSFLEKKHAAHCEIFASAFIMMARALDIPARYVKGYCAHEWNDIGKYIDVRLCDAHAWAEVYIPEKGWVTIEATPVAVWQEEIKRRNSVLLLLWEKILDFCKDAKEEIGKIFHQKMLFILLILIALSISLAGLYILRRLFLYKPTPGIQPKNPKIKKLYEKFLSQECLSNIRGKYQQETIRNYFQYIYNFLPDNRKSFARELLFSLEKDIYSEKAIPDIELERLEELFSIECKTL